MLSKSDAGTAAPQKVISGNPDASPAETERQRNQFVNQEGTIGTRARHLLGQSFDPSQPIAPADSLSDWAGRVVPRSITQLAPKIATGLYEGVKGQTDPLVNAVTGDANPGGMNTRQTMETNAATAVKGTGAAMLSGVGFGMDQDKNVNWSVDNAKNAWLTDPAMAAAGLAPMVKPAMNAAAPVLSAGRVALGAVGDVAAAAANKVSPESLYASSLKMSTGKNLSVADRVARAQTGLEGGYVPTEKGYGKLIDDIGSMNDQISTKIQEAKAGGKMVPLDAVLEPLKGIRERAQYDINPQPLLEKINDIETNLREHPLASDIVNPDTGEITNGIPVDVAQKMKIETYRSLKSAYGEMKSGEVEARKAVARGLKEQIVAAVPEIADLNAKDSALINLEKSLGQATKRIGNRDVTGIGGPLKIAGGAMADLAGGHGLGITAGALLWALDNPTVKANLAIALFKARKAAGRAADMAAIKAEVNKLAAKVKPTSTDSHL